jgi:hypothetical protein
MTAVAMAMMMASFFIYFNPLKLSDAAALEETNDEN